MKCEYCEKEIGAREFYVVEHWSDVEGVLHKRALHSVNGKNFMDNCYHRFNHGFPKDTIIEIQFPECDRPDPDYDMLVQVKNKHNLEHLKCNRCGVDLTMCMNCKQGFSENDIAFCSCAYDHFSPIYHIHGSCSTHPFFAKAIK